MQRIKKDNRMFVYLIVYGGGLGENTWDNELEVEANDIQEALNVAADIVYKLDGHIVSIEQQ